MAYATPDLLFDLVIYFGDFLEFFLAVSMTTGEPTASSMARSFSSSPIAMVCSCLSQVFQPDAEQQPLY